MRRRNPTLSATSSFSLIPWTLSRAGEPDKPATEEPVTRGRGGTWPEARQAMAHCVLLEAIDRLAWLPGSTEASSIVMNAFKSACARARSSNLPTYGVGLL
jgi:hypothetical protein